MHVIGERFNFVLTEYLKAQVFRIETKLHFILHYVEDSEGTLLALFANGTELCARGFCPLHH